MTTKVYVRHGYTMDDLDRFARTACRRAFASVGDVDTRYEVAWSGIAEVLCCADEAPRPEGLIRAGWLAINREMQQVGHLYGVAGPGMTLRNRYVYWVRREPVGHDTTVVERIAVHQILPLLTPAQQEAVIALAVHGEYRLAAEALGIGAKALHRRLSNARAVFFAEWFAPETPPSQRHPDHRSSGAPREVCSAGHELVGENAYHATRGIRCRICVSEYSKARWRARKEGAA